VSCGLTFYLHCSSKPPSHEPDNSVVVCKFRRNIWYLLVHGISRMVSSTSSTSLSPLPPAYAVTSWVVGPCSSCLVLVSIFRVMHLQLTYYYVLRYAYLLDRADSLLLHPRRNWKYCSRPRNNRFHLWVVYSWRTLELICVSGVYGQSFSTDFVNTPFIGFTCCWQMDFLCRWCLDFKLLLLSFWTYSI